MCISGTQTMPRRMAVTHADLEPRRRKTGLSSKTGALFMVLTILLGLFCFTLCLIAEATRTQVTWMDTADEKGSKSECVYSGSGKTPLLCSTCAFIGLAIATLVEQTYMLITITNSSSTLLTWEWNPNSASAISLKWQAGFFFITTWICFAVGEILLLAGVSVESGHLRNWSKPRPTCLTIKEGLFTAAGVFALTTVFLTSALYLTGLRALRISKEQENVRHEVLVISTLHASPPIAPQPHITTVTRENPTTRETLSVFPTPFSKSYTFV